MFNRFHSTRLQAIGILGLLVLSACNNSKDPVNMGANPPGTSAPQASQRPEPIQNTNPEPSVVGTETEPEVFRKNSNWERRGYQILRRLYGLEFRSAFQKTQQAYALPCALATAELTKVALVSKESIRDCFSAMIGVKNAASSILSLHKNGNGSDIWKKPISDEDRLLLVNASNFLLSAAKQASDRESVSLLTNTASLMKMVYSETIDVSTAYFTYQQVLNLAFEYREDIGTRIFEQYYVPDSKRQKHFRGQSFKRIIKLAQEQFGLGKALPEPSARFAAYKIGENFSNAQMIQLEKIRTNLLAKEADPEAGADKLQRMLVQFPIATKEVESKVLDANMSLELNRDEVARILERNEQNRVHRWFERHESEFELGLAATLTLLEAKDPPKAIMLKQIIDGGIKVHNLIMDFVRNGTSLPNLLLASVETLSEVLGIDVPGNLEESLILQQIDILHQNLQQIQSEMHTRFDRLDRSMSLALKMLVEIQAENSREFGVIKARLNELEAKLSFQNRSILFAVQSLADSNYKQSEFACLGPNSSLFMDATPVTSTTVSDSPSSCLANFIDRAGRKTATYPRNEVKDSWTSVPYLQCRYFGKCARTRNPQDWYLGTNAYMDYIAKAGLLDNRQETTIRNLIRQGRDIASTWDEFTSTEFRESLLNALKESDENLRNELVVQLKNYELANFYGIKMAKLAKGDYENHDPKYNPLEVGYRLSRMAMPQFTEVHVDFGGGYIDYQKNPHLIRNSGTVVLKSGTKAFWLENDGSQSFVGYWQVYGYARQIQFNLDLCQNSSSHGLPNNEWDCKAEVVKRQAENFARTNMPNIAPESVNHEALFQNIAEKLKDYFQSDLGDWEYTHLPQIFANQELNARLIAWAETSEDIKNYSQFYLSPQNLEMETVETAEIAAWMNANSHADYRRLAIQRLNHANTEEEESHFFEVLLNAKPERLSSVDAQIAKLEWLLLEAMAQ